MKIVFTDIHEKETGHVTIKSGKMTGFNPAKQEMVDSWLERGRTVQQFIDKYREYSNGFMWSELQR